MGRDIVDEIDQSMAGESAEVPRPPWILDFYYATFVRLNDTQGI